MSLYDFEIGLTEVGMQNVEDLGLPAPAWEYRPWAAAVALGNGSGRGQGAPVAVWRWGFLTRAQRTTLRTYCTGKAAFVYINTIEDDGTYGTYYAALHWPDQERWQADRVLEFAIEFRQLEAA